MPPRAGIASHCERLFSFRSSRRHLQLIFALELWVAVVEAIVVVALCSQRTRRETTSQRPNLSVRCCSRASTLQKQRLGRHTVLYQQKHVHKQHNQNKTRETYRCVPNKYDFTTTRSLLTIRDHGLCSDQKALRCCAKRCFPVFDGVNRKKKKKQKRKRKPHPPGKTFSAGNPDGRQFD